MSVFQRASAQPSVLKEVNVGYATDTNPVNLNPIKPSVFGTQMVAPTQLRQLTVVSDDDIDKIGESVSREIGQTTQKIIDKMAVGKFDELGAILTAINGEVDKLDPASLQKGGVVGWFQANFTNMKAKLTMRLKSAQDVFTDLEGKIGNHITVQQEWVRDLELLYNENYAHYQKINEESVSAQSLIDYVVNQLQTWPEIDLNDNTAAMQVQMKRDAETRLNRLRMKLDNLGRLRVMTETNSPKIRQQQDTSRMTISTLKDVISQTIPIVKMEFAMFLQTLDVQKSVSLTNEVRNLATKTLTQGADSAKIAAIESAKAMNTSVITTDTLQTIRARMLETVVEVKRIENTAQVQRETDAKLIQDGQKSLLTALQQMNTI